MSLFTIIGAGALLVSGIAFALFMGLSSNRLDHEREERAGHIA